MFRNRNLSVITWFRLLRVAQKIDRAGDEHITCHGLSGALFDVLAQIGADEGVTQQELADHLLVTKGNISQLLTKLDQQVLIERRQQGHANHLYLTDKGRALLAEIIPQHDVFIAEHMQKLSDQELRQLNDLLRKLDRSLK